MKKYDGISATVDYALYCFLCIISFGGVWAARIIITTAIRHAFVDVEKVK